MSIFQNIINHKLNTMTADELLQYADQYQISLSRKEASQIAIKMVAGHLESPVGQNDHFITKVYFVCFDEENFQLYRLLLSK